MSRLTHFLAFTPPTNHPRRNLYSLQPSIRWAQDEQIRIASMTEPTPLGGLGRSNLCAHLLEINPSGLSSCFPGLWTPRQPASSIDPPSSILVAHFVPGRLPVCLWMLSLCHLQNSTSLTCWKIVPITHSTSSMVPHWSQLHDRSPQLRGIFLYSCCSW